MDKKVLDVKWVYAKKDENLFKSRLVVRGFQQEEYVENIYAPVTKMQSLKILLSYCVRFGLKIEQMDVETAFLNGKINSEIYVEQPEGFMTKSEEYVCKLNKTLYGLRESPRAWYDVFDKYITQLGFVKCEFEVCLYVLVNDNDQIFIILFVDDTLICSKNESNIQKIKQFLSEKFKMKDLGKIKKYLGINRI